tara:strand:+ start:2023 stop:2583 length:561 start_codon:yes stop_codon:yes gene_type:complete
MVKNKVGGNKAKKYGRKHVLGDNQMVKVRFTKEEGEMYAIVIKHYGQGRMDVLCEDDNIRSCIIRKKFRGRHRHNNKAVVGYFVMVGIREWETTSKNKETCDLLETYDDQEKDRLIQRQPNVPFNYMLKRCNDLCGNQELQIGEDENMIDFTNNSEEESDNEEENNKIEDDKNNNFDIDSIDFDEI